MITGRHIILAAVAFGATGCIVGETFDSVSMLREADGARATCSSGVYGVGILGQSKKAPAELTRCVAACAKAGFVIVKSFPRRDLITKMNEVSDVPEIECAILRKS